MTNHLIKFCKIIKNVLVITSLGFGIISLSRLIFNLARLPISEFVGQFFVVYQTVVYPPVSFVASMLLGWEIGEVGLDLIVLYAAIGFSMRLTFFRALSLDRELNENHYLKPFYINGFLYHYFLFLAALVWPFLILWLIESPKIVLRYSGTDRAYLQPTNRKGIDELLKSNSSGISHVYIGDLRYWVLWNFLAIIAGILVLVAFNFVYAD